MRAIAAGFREAVEAPEHIKAAWPGSAWMVELVPASPVRASRLRPGILFLTSLRTVALNLLRLAGFDSIREGRHAVMHDITALLAIAMRQPREKPS